MELDEGENMNDTSSGPEAHTVGLDDTPQPLTIGPNGGKWRRSGFWSSSSTPNFRHTGAHAYLHICILVHLVGFLLTLNYDVRNHKPKFLCYLSQNGARFHQQHYMFHCADLNIRRCFYRRKL